jgi:hypothetical protein
MGWRVVLAVTHHRVSQCHDAPRDLRNTRRRRATHFLFCIVYAAYNARRMVLASEGSDNGVACATQDDRTALHWAALLGSTGTAAELLLAEAAGGAIDMQDRV